MTSAASPSRRIFSTKGAKSAFEIGVILQPLLFQIKLLVEYSMGCSTRGVHECGVYSCIRAVETAR